jgi:uncharacterized membrane protein YfcA
MALLQNPAFLVPFGVFVGVFSGLMGLGGGAVIIPMLVLVFGFDQKTAHGTSLAMILSPPAFPAIWKYWNDGFVNWRLVMWVLPGMLAGSYLGAKLAIYVSQEQLKLIFGLMLIYVAAYTVFGTQHMGRTLVLAGIVTGVAVALYIGTRLVDRSALQ